jgi:aryl-alcohol dehydrogenase-like predicted oxidoreductase
MTTNTNDSPVGTGTPDAASAGTWQLGDRSVNRIGLGAMRLVGRPWDRTPSDRDAAIAVLRRAVELGVNHIDTAAFYFAPLRSSNELIGAALQPYPDGLVITTKVGPARSRNGDFEPMGRPDELRAQVEENIRQLGRDHLDVVNLRWGTGMAGQGRAPDSVAEHFGALADLREAGLVRHLGISNIVAEQLTEAMAIAPVVCVQNQYGLTSREDDALVTLCGEHGIAFVPFFAIGAAVPGASPGGGADETGKAEVAAVARAHGATDAQVRLAWTLHRGPHVLAIPGTSSVTHLEENVAAGALRLSEAELALLDGVVAASDPRA